MNNEGVRKLFEVFGGFAGKSVSLRFGGQVFGVRLGVVGFWGCLAARPCCDVGLFCPMSDFLFHVVSLLKPDFGGSVR